MKQRLITAVTSAIGLALYFTLIAIAQQAHGGPVNRPAEEYEYAAHLPVVIKLQEICREAPLLLEPPNGAHLDNIIPQFKWNSGNDPAATRLRLRLAKDPGFNEVVSTLTYGSAQGAGQFRFSNNRDPGTTYYWKAWLECDGVDGPFSEARSFTTGSGGTILPAPSLITPKDGTALASLPAPFEWSAVNGAVEYIMHWREVGRSGYTYSWVDKTNRDLTWLESAADYEWWVTARSSYALGDDSETWQFKSPAAVFAAQLLLKRPAGVVAIEQDGGQIIYTTVEETP